jgi:lysophospholipase L1-like esterase
MKIRLCLIALSAIAVVAIFVSGIRHPARVAADPVEVDAVPLPTSVPATDKRIHYIGRFDTSDPDGPRCEWPASEVEVNFHGTALNVVINEEGEDRYEVVIDGWPLAVLPIHNGKHVYSVASGLPALNHSLSLFKRTEASFGRTQFVEFQINDGDHLNNPGHYTRRRIEAVGDSITTGYGNEGTPNEKGTIDNEDCYLSYGAIAARFLKADYHCIAWSGKKLWPDNDMPSITGLTLPKDASIHWDASNWVPQVIIVNLGSNDFYPDNPDKTGWVNACMAFLQTLRTQDPKAMMYLTLGPMMSDTDPPGHHALSTLRDYLNTVVAQRQALGDKRIRLLEFEQEDPATGVGAEQHPNIETHEEMAERLDAAIQSDLRWK